MEKANELSEKNSNPTLNLKTVGENFFKIKQIFYTESRVHSEGCIYFNIMR